MGRQGKRGMDQMPSGMDLFNAITGSDVDSIVANAPKSEIPINAIMLDPAQPRRVMPDDLRQEYLQSGCSNEAYLFNTWLERAKEEKPGGVAGWRDMLRQMDRSNAEGETDTEQPAKKSTPYTDSWIALVGLAADIHDAGLQQRIAVVELDGGKEYGLLYGERRLMAYHLLNWEFNGGYETIPARIVDEYSAFIQAMENGSRAGLNAIERARQLALVLYAFPNNDAPLIEAGTQPSWDWYAKAADTARIPRGKMEMVARICGMSDDPSVAKVQVAQYKDVLRLPEAVAKIADDCNWPEGTIRRIVRDAEKLGYQLLTYARIEAGLQAPPEASKPTSDEKIAASAQRAVDRIAGVKKLKINQEWNHRQRQAIRQEIADARRVLDELEAGL